MLDLALDNARVHDLHHQAVRCRNLGELDQADAHWLMAFTLAEGIDGFDPACLATLRSELASLRWLQQRHDDALDLHLDVLRCREQLFSASHQLVGRSLQSLGDCYLELGRLAEAEQVLERAVQVYREDTPDDLEPVGACLASLGAAHLQQEHLAQAHRALQESLVIYEVLRPLNERAITVLGEQLKAIQSHSGFRRKGAWWRFW